MSASLLAWIFWLCVGATAYHYAGYPLLLFMLAQLSQARSDFQYLASRVTRRAAISADYLPRVAVLVSVYNEEAVIESKIKNVLATEYPSGQIEFLLGLDAPTDATVEICGQFPDSRLRVFGFEARRGKLAVLIDLARRTSAEILVFTDANTMLDRDCIGNLVRHFTDARVGAVSGEEVRFAAVGTDPGAESLYWRYESALKLLESRLNCSLGGNGSALAVRHSLFHPPQQSIVEDFQIPLEIRFRGYRVIYDPDAVGVEEIAPTFTAQFARRVRIGAGNYQTLFKHPEYLDPRKGLLSFCFFSHRVLRWFIPVLLVIAFLSNMFLVERSPFAVLFAVQCLFYGMALLGHQRRKKNRPSKLFAVPLHFCSMNLALLLGLLRYVRGEQSAVWASTPRTADGALLPTGTIGTTAKSANTNCLKET
jgi:cellulose synthase/poly-beta-1,6-N-acetylglucosamine synthase-like glycosyltransferase